MQGGEETCLRQSWQDTSYHQAAEHIAHTPGALAWRLIIKRVGHHEDWLPLNSIQVKSDFGQSRQTDLPSLQTRPKQSAYLRQGAGRLVSLIL
jgi:hypothetical protein